MRVFQVTGLKSLGKVGTHIFLKKRILEKIYNLMHFEIVCILKCIKKISRKPKKF